MSIFRRENGPASPTASSGGSSESPASASQKRRLTHIAPGTLVQGTVSGPTELLIEGEVQGEIRVDSLVMIGGDGAVEGPISAPVVRVGGRVVGDVRASDRVEVAASGSLEGDISAPRVVIAEGAFFKGRVEMTGEKSREARRAKGPGEGNQKAQSETGKS
ncbi:MAG TPA: polymer-forming cytoskeletal protein [Thermoanaerobaculia bacterium]|nr:polymer-forming cytoskeletal protein [Thermoanaerobaculia bacterium]